MDVPGHYIDFKLIKRIFAQFSLHLSIFLLLFYLGYTTIRDLFLSEVGYIVFYMLFVSFGLGLAMLCSYLLSHESCPL